MDQDHFRFDLDGESPDDDDPVDAADFNKDDGGLPLVSPYLYGEPEDELDEDVPGEPEDEPEEDVSDEPEDELEEDVSDEPEDELDEDVSDEPEDELEEDVSDEPEDELEESESVVSEPQESEGEEEQRAISSDLIRGHINTIILRSLYDGDKYGYEIIAEIERKSHNQYSIKQPSLYSALKRLEKEGYITSYWGGSVSGGRRKYFSLTDEGKEIAERNQTEWEYSRTVIDSLISDKQFDFARPAPAAVDMRVLKQSTSRVPDRESEESEFEEPFSYDREELAAQRAAFEEERSRYEESLRVREEVLRAREEAGTKREQELLEREFALAGEEQRREEEAESEQRQLQAEEAKKAFEENGDRIREALEALETERKQLDEEKARLEQERGELQQAQEQAQQAALAASEIELAKATALAREKEEQNARIREMEPFAEERARYEQLLRDREEELLSMHERELAEQERRIRAEDEQLYRRREQQIIHQNYLNLVNGVQNEEPPTGSYYYEDAAPAEPMAYVAKPEAEREYRSIIRKLYDGALPSREEAPPAPAPVAPPAPTPIVPETAPSAKAPEPAKPESPAPKVRTVRSLDGVDFYDLESRAAQDGIRITTSGGARKELKEKSESLVHRGKALFLSALVVFLLCLAEGSIALGFQSQLKLPRFYPYFIWGSGLALFLITGLMYLNHYGERSLRKTGNLLVNVIVAYALCIILILIVALTAKVDFADMGQLTTFVILPAVYFFSIVVFGIAYYLQVRPIDE